MGGWKIERTVGEKSFKYRFPSRYILKTKSTVTVCLVNTLLNGYLDCVLLGLVQQIRSCV